MQSCHICDKFQGKIHQGGFAFISGRFMKMYRIIRIKKIIHTSSSGRVIHDLDILGKTSTCIFLTNIYGSNQGLSS